MIRIVIVSIFFVIFLNAVETSSSLTRQKIEVLELKNELNNFYEQKEKEYQAQKKEIEDLTLKLEQEKAEIKQLHDKNEELLLAIRQEIKRKMVSVFEQMKAKTAAQIFDQMILEGKIEDVFDIIIRLKETNISNIMKFLSLENASLVTYRLEKMNKDKTKGTE